jgi:anti-sigma regulatory factor (Ser/Thr protein kinase)
MLKRGNVTGKMWDGRRSGSGETRRVATASRVAVHVPLDLVLPCSVQAPGLARQALRTWLAAIALSDELVEDASLVVSEIVTNAVVHACSAPRLFVTVADGRLRVEVHDTSRALPVLRAPSAAAGGQGLHIVARVAHACGCSTSTGKVVWIELLATVGGCADRVRGDHRERSPRSMR